MRSPAHHFAGHMLGPLLHRAISGSVYQASTCLLLCQPLPPKHETVHISDPTHFEYQRIPKPPEFALFAGTSVCVGWGRSTMPQFLLR